MKIVELRAKSKEELKDLVLSLKKEQFNLRMQAGAGQLENRGRFKDVRRTIARAMTVMGGGDTSPAAAKEPKAPKAKAAAPKKTAAKKDKKEKD